MEPGTGNPPRLYLWNRYSGVAPSLAIFVTKNFGCEGFDHSAMLPGIQRQSGFAAGLFQKGDAIPPMLDRDLRQQQAATTVPVDVQSVAADFDLVGVDRFRERENAQFDREVRSFFFGDRRKAVVVESGRPRGLRYSAVERIARQDVADTSAPCAPE